MKKELIETRKDRHGNECVIHKVESDGIFRDLTFTVSYKDSARRWLNRSNGSPYFASLRSAQKKIDRN